MGNEPRTPAAPKPFCHRATPLGALRARFFFWMERVERYGRGFNSLFGDAPSLRNSSLGELQFFYLAVGAFARRSRLRLFLLSS